MAKRLFISHSWEYSERYTSMVSLLNSRKYFDWVNYSVPVDKAFEGMTRAQLQEQLRNQIRPVNCVIIISGMWFNHSDWIQFEMDFANQIGKPVLGVRPRGAKKTPVAIEVGADKTVNWNTESIVDGIREIS
ncbi:TIR domain-containing protein [Rhodosalinus sediminis]|uniref:TIR domain-containing protein n=1 Tax=Rhodosalinus sediminis TaxID=1940533 RepID=UPI0023543666|nr:TIR domain-containing protein [Rhodosalinus sediminis]